MAGTYTVAILGEGGVGKTSILNRIAQKGFSPKYLSTGGKQELIIDVPTNKGNVELKFIDFGGQDKYLKVVSSELKSNNPNLAIIVGDKSDNVSLEKISKWNNLIFGIPQLIVINKKELVASPDSQTLLNKLSSRVIYVSAKTGEGIDMLLDKIIERVTNDRNIKIL